jgi:hypothetical protein
MFSFRRTSSKVGRYQLAGQLEGHTSAINTLDFSPRRIYLASGGELIRSLTYINVKGFKVKMEYTCGM